MKNIQQEQTITKSIVLERGWHSDIWMGYPIGWRVGTLMVEKKTFWYDQKRQSHNNDDYIRLTLITQRIPTQDIINIIVVYCSEYTVAFYVQNYGVVYKDFCLENMDIAPLLS